MDPNERERAIELDTRDPLANFVERYFDDDEGLVYLDGNSLGRLPIATVDHLRDVVVKDWGSRLIRAWGEGWIDLSQRVGDTLGREFLGAGPGQVVIADSTSVNFYKLAVAALDERPSRKVIVTDKANFPTDRYILQSLAESRDLELRLAEFDDIEGPVKEAVESVIDDRTALVSFSHVDYRSSALADMGAINSVVARCGALNLWDLSHSVGAVPIELDQSGTDLAVGCTYKYLNGGPGAPALLYVRRALQDRLRQPIWGWWGQHDQFEMGESYEPAAGIDHFLVGTPSVLGLSAVQSGIAELSEARIDRLREKSIALGEYAIELAERWLYPLGFSLASPKDPARRGSHISLAHPEAYRISQALIKDSAVIPDFRPPDRLRLGAAPVYTRFIDVSEAVVRLHRLVASEQHLLLDRAHARVT